ncbi:hypothetical protein MG068_13080 [Stenotrophomonas sp. ASS1]|nr:hypothetical protein MG068_13080 [Stenotrophomonas sp. ASS1]QDY48807.1 hypothetical protein DUW70_09815 [Stenotrophomonas maltophilia]
MVAFAHVHVGVLDYRQDALAAIGQDAHINLHCTAAAEALLNGGSGAPPMTPPATRAALR